MPPDFKTFIFIKCPFCPNHSIEASPGKTTCPECSAEFEVDDRVECIFINPNKLRLPMAVTRTNVPDSANPPARDEWEDS
jgi:hypothetical protein